MQGGWSPLLLLAEHCMWRQEQEELALVLAELLLLGGAEAASATVQGEGVSTGSCTDAAMLRGM